MAKDFQHPEYKPYPGSAPVDNPYESRIDTGYIPTKSELIKDLLELIDLLDQDILAAELKISSQAIINTGRDETLNQVISDVWDTGIEIPLGLYEKASISENAKHRYLAQTALRTSRSVSGDYSLDMIDLFRMAKVEASALLSWLQKSGSVRGDDLTVPICDVAVAVRFVHILGVEERKHNAVDTSTMTAAVHATDAAERSAAIQKSLHLGIEKLSEVIEQHKSTWSQISSSSDSFYNDKVEALDTGYPPDTSNLSTVLTQRAALIRDATANLLQAINTGDALKEAWEIESSTSKVTVDRIAQQAYVTYSPKNKGSAAKALDSFTPIISSALSDGYELFVRKQGYTLEDSQAIVNIINNLPDTSTYIRAGVIAIRTETEFVDNLLQQINDMPSGTTLISGGMISLTGKTLAEFQEEVEAGVFAGERDVQTLVDTLNELDGRSATVLLPGVIGLSGEADIREAIIGCINGVVGGATLIGPGTILISGDETLADRYPDWDATTDDFADTLETLSWFGITDTTLIDGSKIMTSGVLVDYLLSGMTILGTYHEIALTLYDVSNVMELSDTTQLVREARSVDTDNTVVSLLWPTASCDHLHYKLETSIDGVNWEYARGDESTWAQFNRASLTDKNGNSIDSPLVLILEGNYIRYARITFGGFQEADHSAVEGSLFCNLLFYGAKAYIDGGNIFANSIQLASLPASVNDTVENFSDRNDRNPNIPNAPAFFWAQPEQQQNSDGTVNVTLSWSY